MIDLSPYRKLADNKLAAYTTAKTAIATESQALVTAQALVGHATQGQDVVQAVAQSVQNKAHAQISSIVSKCLGAVWDDPYEFRIIFERKRGRTEARLTFWRNSEEINPRSASGGGALDVAALGLRISDILIKQPASRKFIVLDEPLKFLSKELRPRAAAIIMELAKTLEIQFLMVTHDPEFQIGKLVELT